MRELEFKTGIESHEMKSGYKIYRKFQIKFERINFTAIQTKTLDLIAHGKTSLMMQWIKIHLPMQGKCIRSLVWEDPTCHGATQSGSGTIRKSSPSSPQLEKDHTAMKTQHSQTIN